MNAKLIGAAKTHPGRVRDINEDSVLFHTQNPEISNSLSLLAVADGIGGHKAGDIASKMAIDTIFESLVVFLENDPSEITRPTNANIAGKPGQVETENYLERRIRVAVENANKKIFDYAQANPENAGNLGTTITCALVLESNLVIAHVGDSRAYRFRNNTLAQLTEDHSFVGQLVREGQLPKEAYYVHPRRNVITRALGQLPHVRVDLRTDILQEGDRILFCTDGLWEMIRDPEIQSHLEQDMAPDEIVSRLIETAIKNGGSDNIGVVLGEMKNTDHVS